MKLLVLCLLFGAAVALPSTDLPENELNNEAELPENELNNEASLDNGLKNGEALNVEDADMQDIADPESVDETELSEAEQGDSAERGRRFRCRPGTWCYYGSRYYVYIPSRSHWAYAQIYCQALGGTLAVVHNRATNRFLKRLARGRRTWIGLSDAQHDNYWLWINGERYVYAKWCRREPNNQRGVESCVHINHTRRKCWNDENCKLSLGFICERK